MSVPGGALHGDDGHAPVALMLSGEAGVGKSRLLHEVEPVEDLELVDEHDLGGFLDELENGESVELWHDLKQN